MGRAEIGVARIEDSEAFIRAEQEKQGGCALEYLSIIDLHVRRIHAAPAKQADRQCIGTPAMQNLR